MRISTKQYAQTLYELTQDKNKSEINGVILKFAEVLKKNKQMRLLSGIIKKFSEIYNKNNGIVEVEVVSARELGEKEKVEIEKFVLSKYQTRKAVLKNSIDENIKGGIVIKIGDEVLDGSVGRWLQELKKALVA